MAAVAAAQIAGGRAVVKTDRIDKVRASGNVAAQAAEYLREGPLNHVDALHHALTRRNPGSGRAVHADSMDFV
jgi:hypothetical protein